MANKKNKSQKPPQPIKQKKGSSNSLGFVKEALTLIGGLAGSILAVYGLVKTFKDDAEGFSWLIFVGIVIWLIILWRLFRVRRTTAYSLLIISMLVALIGWVGWQSQIKAVDEKVIVLVALFDGPEETYGLRNQIMEELHNVDKANGEIIILDGKEVVTSAQGSQYARKLGGQENADLVIWAWYRPTDNPNITIHFENLSTEQIETLQSSETYQPQATLAGLKSFEAQQRIGAETKTLISFIAGMISLQSGDYQKALNHFEPILVEKNISTYIDPATLYFYIGNSHLALNSYQLSIENFTQLLILDPNDAEAYNNRGIAYYFLKDYDSAIQDYDKVIELDPNFVVAYMNRGEAYRRLGQYNLALLDCNKAIELIPNSAIAYSNRGEVYNSLLQYEKAIQDLNKAIELSPSLSPAYFNRGRTYYFLEQYDKALDEFGKAIDLDPNYVNGYVAVGVTYASMEEYEHAIQEFDKALKIDPKNALAYMNRGVAFRELGKTAEAEADFKKYEELTGQEP